MSNLYTAFEGFAIDKPTLFDGLAIYPLVNNESNYSLPYITLSYKNETERKALIIKIKSLWYAICFIYYLENGTLGEYMKCTSWYDSDTTPALSCGDNPPKIGGYLSRLRAAEGGGRLAKAAKSLSWLILYLPESNTEQRVIKLQNAFGQLYGDYGSVPTALSEYAEDIKRRLNAEEPESFVASAKKLSSDDIDKLEMLFVKEFIKQYGKLFIQ